jgi:uncharacterized membrane protein YfcA
VPVTTALLLVLAGIGAGLAGSVAGLSSLVSYPALLAVGLSPVAANVTNTVALIWTSVGSVWGYRPELVGEARRIRVLAPVAALGGITGGVVLLVTPASAFARVVPWLIGAGSLAVVLRRSPGAEPAHRTRRGSAALVAGVFAVAVYGGYFGAAAGVVLLGLLLFATMEPLARCRGLTSVLLGVANAVAAVAFALDGPVHWDYALPLAVGCLIGGRLGPPIVRRAPVGPLRVAIALAGLALAVHLGLDAY